MDITGLTRAEFDGSGRPRTRYEDFEVGASLGTLDWTVTREQVQGLLDNDEDHHSWYDEASPFGQPIVPPMATYPPVRILFTRRYNVRGLFYIFETEFLAPIFYNQPIVVSGNVADKWIKRDREFIAYEAHGVDAEGRVLFRTRRAHVLDFIPRTAPRVGTAIDSGTAVPRS